MKIQTSLTPQSMFFSTVPHAGNAKDKFIFPNCPQSPPNDSQS